MFVADHVQGAAIDHIVHRGDHLANELADVRGFRVKLNVRRVQPSHFHGVIDELIKVLGFLIGDLDQFRLALRQADPDWPGGRWSQP